MYGFLSGILIRVFKRSCEFIQGFSQGFIQGLFRVSFKVSFRVSLGFKVFFGFPRVYLRFLQCFMQGFVYGFFRVSVWVPFRVSFRVFQSVVQASLGCHLGFRSKFRQGFIYGFFKLIYGFFRVHLVFRVGVSQQEFFRVSLGFTQGLKVSFRVQTGENKAKE